MRELRRRVFELVTFRKQKIAADIRAKEAQLQKEREDAEAHEREVSELVGKLTTSEAKLAAIEFEQQNSRTYARLLERLLRLDRGTTSDRVELLGKLAQLTDHLAKAEGEIETLKAWIDQGAQTASPEPETISEQYFTEEESRFWAFQPIVKRAVPILNTERMLSSPVDYFVLEKLRAKLLEFTDQAPREVLIRRLYFDLLGLPPSVDAVEPTAGAIIELSGRWLQHRG